MKKRIIFFGIAVFLFVFITINYKILDDNLINFLKNYETANVSRVIDGDTIVTDSNEHIRLLGINAPETSSKEKYSDEAKEFLSNYVLNKTVRLETEGKDLYNRTLAYVFLGDDNVNQKIVESGLANVYFPTNTRTYYKELFAAWNNCLNENINLCKKSGDKCSNCIELEKFDYKSQEVILFNKCYFSCNLTNWQIKDEGRKEFNFPALALNSRQNVTIIVGNKTGNQSYLFWPNYSYVWTSSGDTMFLRDNNHDLVLWKNY